MNTSNPTSIVLPTRRAFIGNCATLASLPILAGLPVNAFAASESNVLKVGLIGAGQRGSGAVHNILEADPNVQLWAIGEIFDDRLKKARDNFSKDKNPGVSKRATVPQERCFAGFDAYKKVLETGVDIIIDASPPFFRPLHVMAAIEKGVHVFAEKPGATDPAGCRKLIAAGELAAKKGLSIVAGTQRRHHKSYVEAFQRVKDGQIGELVGGQVYWVGGSTDGFWKHQKRQDNWTDMEYQIRNWYAFAWLCGDHIVEQHVHNLDIANWAFGGPPIKAIGMGGRQRRNWGNIWDHFSVEFEYANGARVASYCRQTDGCANRVAENIVGTLGSCAPGGTSRITGKNAWKFSGRARNPYVQEHKDLIDAIRNNKPINEAKAFAESTLTGILGRMSAYSGKEIKFSWVLEASKLDYTPEGFDFNAAPPDTGVPVPGKTQPI